MEDRYRFILKYGKPRLVPMHGNYGFSYYGTPHAYNLIIETTTSYIQLYNTVFEEGVLTGLTQVYSVRSAKKKQTIFKIDVDRDFNRQ